MIADVTNGELMILAHIYMKIVRTASSEMGSPTTGNIS